MRRCCSQSSRRNFQWVARMEIGNYKLFWSNQNCFVFFCFFKKNLQPKNITASTKLYLFLQSGTRKTEKKI